MHRLKRIGAQRAGARGVTLIEVMIVVVIIGLISAGVAAAVFPMHRKAQIGITHANAAYLRRSADAWRSERGGEECPTPARLRDDNFVDRGSKLDDPWGMPFKIVCRDDSTTVISLGPDKKESGDDIVEPEPIAMRE